jgi:hypothetical protein
MWLNHGYPKIKFDSTNVRVQDLRVSCGIKVGVIIGTEGMSQNHQNGNISTDGELSVALTRFCCDGSYQNDTVLWDFQS